jgi:diguanylate cyclase (GGDEF)-like protein
MIARSGTRSVGHRRRPIHTLLAVILAVLFVGVELLVLVSSERSSNTTMQVEDATHTTGTLAAISREALLLRNGFLTMRDQSELDSVQVQRALLERQLFVLEGSSRDPLLHEGIDRFRASLATLDDGIARIQGADPAGIAAEATRMRAPVDEMEILAKQLFDSEERRLHAALDADIDGARRTQVMLLGMGGFVLLLGTSLAFFLRRSIRADFAQAHDDLVGEMTERVALQGQLAHQAYHDPLTGLANTVMFFREVQRALERAGRNSSTTAVVYIDLDGFKAVNDTLGHSAGDQLLQQVATRLEEQIRSVDTAARLGGDEFAILLEDAGTEQDVLAIVDRMLAALTVPFTVVGRELTVTASMGVVTASGSHADVDQLVKDADLAMYKSKGAGKCRYTIFDEEMRQEAQQRNTIEEELERAIAEREFVLHYQPIVDLRSGEIQGMEALVRWQHPSGELRPPLSFIGIAEETGLINAIGDQVLEMATQTMADWHRTTPGARDVFVSVNVSARQFREPGFVERISEVLSRTGLDPHALVIEITESVMMNETDQAVGILRELRNRGVRIAIDDFGTGYSSLSYLRFMPVDILKLDRSFVASLSEDNAITVAIAQLASTLGIQAVAEGIEEPEQWDRLLAMGCLSGQGFLIARPQPASEAVAHLEAGPMLESRRTAVPLG